MKPFSKPSDAQTFLTSDGVQQSGGWLEWIVGIDEARTFISSLPALDFGTSLVATGLPFRIDRRQARCAWIRLERQIWSVAFE